MMIDDEIRKLIADLKDSAASYTPKGYVPTLLKDGLSRQEEWGVLRVVRATLV